MSRPRQRVPDHQGITEITYRDALAGTAFAAVVFVAIMRWSSHGSG